jgi:hypothetical protein
MAIGEASGLVGRIRVGVGFRGGDIEVAVVFKEEVVVVLVTEMLGPNVRMSARLSRYPRRSKKRNLILFRIL